MEGGDVALDKFGSDDEEEAAAGAGGAAAEEDSGDESDGQGLTLVHFSAQLEPIVFFVATASVHFPSQPVPFLGHKHTTYPTKLAEDTLTSGGVQPTKGAYVELRSGRVSAPDDGYGEGGLSWDAVLADVNGTGKAVAAAPAGGARVNPRKGRGSGGRGLHSSTSQLNVSRFSHKTHPTHPVIPPNISHTPPLKTAKGTPYTLKALTLNRKVNECKPLCGGVFDRDAKAMKRGAGGGGKAGGSLTTRTTTRPTFSQLNSASARLCEHAHLRSVMFRSWSSACYRRAREWDQSP